MPGGCSKISSICGSNREFTKNIKFWNRTIFGTDASKSNPKRVILSHTLHHNTPCSAETESFFQFLGRLRLNPAILFYGIRGLLYKMFRLNGLSVYYCIEKSPFIPFLYSKRIIRLNGTLYTTDPSFPYVSACCLPTDARDLHDIE